MVFVNPLNVINLLLLAFPSNNIPQSPISNADREMAKNIQEMLMRSMTTFVNVEENESLDFEDPSSKEEPVAVEDSESENEDFSSSGAMCSQDDDQLDYDYKARAVAFWRSGQKGNLQLNTVTHWFKNVKSVRQLWCWANQHNKGGTYMEKLGRISQFTLSMFNDAIERHAIVHDLDIKRWAPIAKDEVDKSFD